MISSLAVSNVLRAAYHKRVVLGDFSSIYFAFLHSISNPPVRSGCSAQPGGPSQLLRWLQGGAGKGGYWATARFGVQPPGPLAGPYPAQRPWLNLTRRLARRPAHCQAEGPRAADSEAQIGARGPGWMPVGPGPPGPGPGQIGAEQAAMASRGPSAEAGTVAPCVPVS